MTWSGRDAPYPEPKATHTMARTGRPFDGSEATAGCTDLGRDRGVRPIPRARQRHRAGCLRCVGDDGCGDASRLWRTRLGASPRHLHALLQALAGMGFVERRGERYELNDTSRRYLTSSGAATMAALVPVAPGPLDNWSHADRDRPTRAAGAPDRGRPRGVLRPTRQGDVRHDPALRPARRPAALVLDPPRTHACWTSPPGWPRGRSPCSRRIRVRPPSSTTGPRSSRLPSRCSPTTTSPTGSSSDQAIVHQIIARTRPLRPGGARSRLSDRAGSARPRVGGPGDRLRCGQVVGCC